MKADNILGLIGGTPHVRLGRLFPDHEVWMKLERQNPAGSIKDRIALAMIEDAERFGLAQLHQLRGRVGRGTRQSYCYLLLNNHSRPSQRLREVEASSDGFHLAEVDMQLRGPGEIYGKAQHGALNLRIASLADSKAIARAQKAAQAFIVSGDSLDHYPELQAAVQRNQRLTTLN